MKTLTLITCLLACLSPLMASEIFTVDAVGVTLSCPDGWKHDAEDTFGFLIRPPAGNDRLRIRVHGTAHKDLSPQVAVQRSVEQMNEIRKNKNLPSEPLISSTPITTKSGIKGQKATLGWEGTDSHPYLHRYYFQKADDTIFCVCVYFYGNQAFAKQSEESIVETLQLIK